MAVTLTCDSCGKAIVSPMDRGAVTLPGDGAMAGASMDLCRDCITGICDHPNIEAGRVTVEERQAAVAEAMTADPAGLEEVVPEPVAEAAPEPTGEAEAAPPEPEPAPEEPAP